MTRLAALVVLAVLGAAGTAGTRDTLAIVGATVVDVGRGETRPEQTVLIERGRIILDANPLKNIRNTRAIYRAIKGGHVIEPRCCGDARRTAA